MVTPELCVRRVSSYLNLNFTKKQTWKVILVVLAGHIMFFAIQIPRAYVLAGRHSAVDYLDWLGVGRLGFAAAIEVVITPFILLAGYHFRFHREKLFRIVGLHFLLAVVAGLTFHFAWHAALIGFNLGPKDLYYGNLLRGHYILNTLPNSIVRYAVILAIQQAYLYFQESQKRAVLLRESELQMLKMQLQPHFFFNTLNAISALTHRAPVEASRLIARLGDMLRISLQKDKAQEVTLKDELEFVETFLEIHKALMGRRLRIEWKIEPETLDALVPNMLLQPLVENAIQHGLAPLEAGGTVSISALRQDEELILEIRDNGQGFTAAPEAHEGGGVGLSNTRARLANLYSGSHDISMTASEGGGTKVAIRLPFRELLGAGSNSERVDNVRSDARG